MRIQIFALVLASASIASVASQAQNIISVDLPHATMPTASVQHVVEVHLGSSVAPNVLVVTPKFTPVDLSAPVVNKAPEQKPSTMHMPTASQFHRVTLASYIASKRQN